jgi:hypothetical protein
MVLYHCLEAQLMSQLLSHRFVVSRGKDAVLMTSVSLFTERRIDLKYLVDNNVFTEIIDINPWIGFELERNGNIQELSQLENGIYNYYKKVFENSQSKVDSFESIYYMLDIGRYEFAYFLNRVQIYYKWIEHAPNRAAHRHLAGHYPYENKQPIYAEFIKKHKIASAGAEFALPVLLDISSSDTLKIFNNKQIDTWNIDACLNQLLNEDIQLICCTFGFDFQKTINEAHDYTLLLCQSDSMPVRGKVDIRLKNTKADIYEKYFFNEFASVRHYTNYAEVLSVDYYLEENAKILVKPHPNVLRTETEVKELFGIDALPFTNLPMEILHFILNKQNVKFKCVLGYNSESLDYVNGISDKIIRLGDDFWNTYWCYHKLYAAVYCAGIYMQAETICVYNSELIDQSKSIGSNILSIQSVISGNEAYYNSTFTIVSEIHNSKIDWWKSNLLNMGYSNVVCFLSYDEMLKILEPQMLEYLLPITIKKKKNSKKSIAPLNDESIYIYAVSKKLYDEFFNFSFHKRLFRLGIEIYSEPMNFAKLKSFVLECSSDLYYRALSTSLNELSIKQNLIEDFILSLTIANPMQNALMGFLYSTIQSCRNIYKYLNLLKLFKEGYLVVICAKGTLISKYTSELISCFASLGLTQISDMLRNGKAKLKGVIAVLHDGIVRAEQIQISEMPLEFFDEFKVNNNNSCSVKIRSAGWNTGNFSEIEIDNADLSCHARGLNFVVYDLVSRKPVDSAAFDTSLVNIPLSIRKQFY